MMDEILADERIDPSRVYLTGLSMGGFGTWELGMRLPERFAAIVPICGGGDTHRAAALVGTPIYAVHGAADSVVPVSQSQVMIAALKNAGGDPHYAELEGVGHNSWEDAYEPDSEVMRWMFEQRREPGRQGTR
jgi:predicted peptidase